MQFSNIVGQKQAKQGLLKMWREEHFPHAILLAGQEGTGGLPLALAMAQYIFCENRKTDDSCGHCAGCRKASKLEHADLHISFPSISPKPGTKAMSRYYIQDFREFVHQTPYGTTYEWLQFINAENKQGNITAEECREMIETLNLKSYEGGSKVHIMWRPEYLGKEGNILLKLIEEPPANTFLIFIAENTEDILPTILSRTQLVRLAPIAAIDIAEVLTDRSLADPKKASQVAHMANGSYAEALRLVRHSENDLFPEVRTWFNSLFTNNGIGIAKFAEEWSKAGREQQKNFLHYIIQLLEQAIRVRYMPDKLPALPDEEAQFVQKLAAMTLPLEVFNKMVKAISQTIYYIERNAHSKTQLHALSIRLVYIIQNKEMPVN
jgi:DNA polymerase-3 subunit delta'